MATDGALKKIGRFEIESLVAEGAMALVYRAHDPEIDRTVAIKVLKDEHGVDEEHVNRFLREAKAAGAISHPNIVTIHDVGRIDNTFYITMEFLDKGSLADVLSKQTRLPTRQVISFGLQLARALDVAHRKGIVHRDIKPGNILLAGNGETVKISDFGIAWLDRPEDPQESNPRIVIGTPRYMSPEQAAGRDLDGRSDLFSLGAILYELLSGKKAFGSDNVATLMLQISLKNPAPLRSIAPDISEGLQRIVMKLLSKLPEQRFQTGAEAADALERELAAAIAEETKPARNPFVPLRLKLTALVGGLVAVFVVMSIAIVGYIESRELERQLLASGAIRAKSIGSDNAVPLLARDWVPIELFVLDNSARGDFDYVVITDRQNVVRASTDKTIVGKPFVPPRNTAMRSGDPNVSAASFTMPGDQAAVLFDTKVSFQEREVGRVYLGVSRANIETLLRSTFLALSILGMSAVAATVAMCLIFGSLIARQLRYLRHSMLALAAGDLERRISQNRNDEIGDLFTAFNRAAESLHAGFVKRNGETATPPLPDANRLLAMAAAKDAEATLVIGSESMAPAGGAETLNFEAPPSERDDLSSEPPESVSRLRA